MNLNKQPNILDQIKNTYMGGSMTHQLEINFVYEEKKNERLRYKRDVNMQRRLNDLFVEA